MTFEGLVDRLLTIFDVGQQRAVDVANERLGRMVAESAALRSLANLGTTVAATATYALPANVVQVMRVEIAFAAGTVIYEGTATVDEFWDLAVGNAYSCGSIYCVEPDADSDMTTDNLRLYPVPTEAGATITGLVALRAAVLTYSSATALPIPINAHPALLAGCKADLYDEDDRQDESQKEEAVFVAGIQGLTAATTRRGEGSGRRRMRVAGYDIPRG